MPVGSAWAQQAPLHLNPAVEKLARGEAIIGTQTDDMSLQNCHSLARLDFDYAYVDMEHGPLNLDGLAYCVAAMVDKAAILKKGNAQPNVALFARFPPYGRDLESNDWIVKQALDMGLMGVIFNGVENKEQMTRLIRFMRYPQQKTSKYQQPPGLRGYAPGNAVFAWGVSAAEYERHADVWPLNPEGDLLAIPMIETLEGLKNVDEIAAVPGRRRDLHRRGRRFAPISWRGARFARSGTSASDDSGSVQGPQRRVRHHRAHQEPT